MTEQANLDPQDRQLWRQHLSRAALATGAKPLDANLLAGYLDGTADERERETVEAACLADPAVLEQLAELREMMGAQGEAPTADLLDRAKALAARRASRLSLGAYWPRLQWAAAAAAIVIACAGGYSFGRDTFQARRRTSTVAASVASLGIEELVAEPALDVQGDNGGGNGGES